MFASANLSPLAGSFRRDVFLFVRIGVNQQTLPAGRAVLDKHLPDYVQKSHHVLSDGNEVYDCMLNQTNVGANNNKFYVIQVLGEWISGSHAFKPGIEAWLVHV